MFISSTNKILCSSKQHNDLILIDGSTFDIKKVNMENKSKGMNNSKFKSSILKVSTN